jgi:hypothetical protein
MNRYRREIVIGALIVLLTFLVFCRVLRNEFVAWDDDLNIYKNSLIQRLNAEQITGMFLDIEQAMRYKPITWLVWALIYAGWGLNPFVYHLTNLVLHCFNAVLIFLLVRNMLVARTAQSLTDSEQKSLLLCAGFAALLWAIHPLRVEPVAWATGLPYDLSLSFMLVSLLAYLRMSQSYKSPRRCRLYWVASILTFVLALLAYPIVLGYAFLLIFFDFFPLRKFDTFSDRRGVLTAKQIWLEKVPF